MHPLEELVKARVSRRDFLALMATLAAAPEVIATPHKSLGFTRVPVSRLDTVTVAPGYTARPFYVWGDPISSGPAWKPDASDTASEQAQQAGMLSHIVNRIRPLLITITIVSLHVQGDH